MKSKIYGWIVFVTILAIISLTACGQSAPAPTSLPPTEIATATLVPPTDTPIPPTATATLIPLPVLEGTPYPEPSAAISPENAASVLLLAQWDKGKAIKVIVWSSDGNTLAAIDRNSNSIELWNAKSGEKLSVIEDTQPIYGIAFSPDSKTLASGSKNGNINIWDVASGQVTATFKHSPIVQEVAFSSDGSMLLSLGIDDVRLWNISSGEQIAKMGGYLGVFSAALSPDNQNIASGTAAGTIVLWDAKSGSELNKLVGHELPIFSFAFSPDSKTLASGSNDKTVRLWNVASESELATLSGHQDAVFKVAFSPDGKILASASADGTIKLWDVANRSELATLTGKGMIFSLAFSPDGHTLVCGSDDGTAQVWGVVP